MCSTNESGLSEKDACKTCPFRKSPLTVYDADAIAAFEGGATPACHSKVGLNSIFAEIDPGKNVCVGSILFDRGHDAFDMPVVAQ